MHRTTKLIRRLAGLGIVGVVAYTIDSWVQENSSIVFGIVEIGLLALWIGVDIEDFFRGTLKAGPEKTVKVKAIDLPLFQVILAAYVLIIAGAAVFGAINGQGPEFLKSPFLVWLVAAPLVALGFILEYRAQGERRET